MTKNQTTGKSLYFSDGWVAAYGKRARAGLKRLTWLNKRPVVESLAASSKEFTFFELWERRELASGRSLIFAQGNKGINLITPQAEGAWRVRPAPSDTTDRKRRDRLRRG